MNSLKTLLAIILFPLLASTLLSCISSPTPASTPVPDRESALPLKQPPPRALPRSFEASVVPEEAYYLPGEPVEVKLLFSNLSSETMTMRPYPPEIQVKPSQQDNVVFSVAAGIQQSEIKPNDTITLEFSWDQRDKAGKQVPPGWYDVTFKDITVTHGQSRSGGDCTARLLIRYSQGAIEKSLDLNQSQTVNGIAVTLERVELTADGASFYVFFVPPGYTAPPTPSTGPKPPSPLEIAYWARAEYCVNGITNSAGQAHYRTEDNGIELVWGATPRSLNPIPSDAKELIFTVTMVLPRFEPTPTTAEALKPTEAPPPEASQQNGNWEGPWEFRISLQ